MLDRLEAKTTDGLKNGMDATLDDIAAPITDLVAHAVGQLVTGTDLQLVEIEMRGHRGSRVIEVYLDSPGGVSVDTLARFSRKLGELVDDSIEGAYRLEVSSPGADRPLTHPFQFPKHVGRVLRIRYYDGEEEIKATGELVKADTIGIELRTKAETISVTYSNLVDGVVQLPW